MTPPDYRKGEGLSSENLQRIDRLASRTQSVSADGMDADFNDGGISLRDALARGFWARLTDIDPSNPLYSWVEQTRLDGTPGTYADMDGGLNGFYDGTGAGALREVNGRRDAPVGTSDGEVVWVTLADDGDTFEFRFGGIAEPAPFVLTAGEVDGSPSVSPVTVIEFDQATGLKVTDQTGGVARVENVDASETQTGVINTTDQTLLGWKDFKTGVLVGRLNGGAALTAEIHFNAFPGSDAREQSRVRVVEDVNHPGGDYQTMILTAGFGSFNYGAEKSAELWVDGESQCFRLYAWTGSSLAHKRPDLFLFNDGGLEVQGQTVTDSGVTWTSGLRTGGTLALSLTGAVTGSLSGGSIATTYAGAVDGGTWV